MNVYIIIPCYNEEQFIGDTLNSLINQTLNPKKIMVVNDNSTDGSEEIVSAFAKANPSIQTVKTATSSAHQPGNKVVQAFNTGLEALDENYDIICKFDADLIFPSNYLEEVVKVFKQQPEAGIVGGFCYIERDNRWALENLTNKDHIRGALKAYRKDCLTQIGGLKPAMGWDTADELLAKYNEWDVITLEQLHVKHLKPTGNAYTSASKFRQGEAFYSLRYGFLLTAIASLKLSFLKGSPKFFLNCLRGFFRAKRTKKTYLVSKKEGEFIRALRWKGIKGKFFTT